MTTAETRQIEPAAGGRQLRHGELISAISALLLLVIMFALKWYGVVGLPRGAQRSGHSASENGWLALTGLRWLMLATILAALGAVLVRGSQRSHGAQTNTGLLVAALGTVCAVLLFVRVLIALPSADSVVDVKLGGYLGLLAAIGIPLGGYRTIQEERARVARIRKQRAARAGVPSTP